MSNKAVPQNPIILENTTIKTRTLLAAAFTVLAITNIRAQDSDPGKDSSPSIWSPERQTLTGDWFGQGSAMLPI